jgi:Ca2+-binding RTX toxin-like protein
VKRILLGALVATTAAVAIPSAANAATCTFNPAARSIDVRYSVGDSTVTLKPAALKLQYKDGAGLHDCLDATRNQTATQVNTDKVTVKPATGTGPQTQTTVIDETERSLRSLNTALQVFVLTGTNDLLKIDKGSRGDRVVLKEQTGGLAFGPLVDHNGDGDPEVRMTTGTSGSAVQVDGGAGDDTLDASAVKTYRAFLFGEGGNDTFFGGAQADVIDGGLGTLDQGHVNLSQDKVSGVEKLF